MNPLVISGLIIFFGIALYLFVFGAKKYLVFTRLKKYGQTADGEVITVKDSIVSCISVISFIDHNNKRQEGIARNTINISRFNRHRVGGHVKIFYDRDDPSIFVVDAPDRLMPLFIAATAALFMGLILFMVIAELFISR